jgi:hypothetical protein
MLTPEMKTVLQRTLPIDHIDADRIVLRGPASRGADIAVVASALNPSCIVFYLLLIGVLLRGPAIGEDLAEMPPYSLPLLALVLISVLLTVASIIGVQRRRTLHIALHRGQYLAHFYGPKGIDVCLPLMHPFLRASVTESGNDMTIWKSPSAYRDRPNRTPWERLLRFWPMGRIPELSLSFPDHDWVGIVPVPGAREDDFIACWEWLLQFIVPARASARPAPPRRVLRIPGAARMLREMSLHSFTDETLGLFWTTNAGGAMRSLTATFMAIGGLLVFLGLGPLDGVIPLWAVFASCPLSTASAILLSLRVYPTVTTFTRGVAGAYIERLRGRERIPEVRIGLENYDGQDQFLMFTPRGTLRGRHVYRKAIVDCSVFIEQFCKPPVETEGVDIDV